jgi:hypothetical protein
MKLLLKINFKVIMFSFGIFVSLFLAFINYPPIIALWEESVVYTTFYPIQYPLPILAINISGDTVGGHDFIRYAFLTISRYFSNMFGCSIYLIRLPSIIYGLICLLLLCIVVKRWYGWRVGLLSAILLATNQTFFTFQHLLLIQTLTLAAILFAVERYQNLSCKKSFIAAITFGFACSILAINYIVGRYCILFLFFLYLFDFENYLFNRMQLINWQRIKLSLVSFVSMVMLLLLYYPPNFYRLFSKNFLFPLVGENVMTGGYSVIQTFLHNFKFFLHFYVLGRDTYASDILKAGVSFPIASIIVFVFAFIGLILLFIGIKKNRFFNIFLFFSFLFMLIMMTEVRLDLPLQFSSTMHNSTKTYFFVPFIVFFASYAIISFYHFLRRRHVSLGYILILFIFCMVFIRVWIIKHEVRRFSSLVEDYNFNFSQKAIHKKINSLEWVKTGTEKVKDNKLIFNGNETDLILNEIYFYHLAKYISTKIKTMYFSSNKPKIIYIPAVFYTPDYIQWRGSSPQRNSPYYFPMFLSIYLNNFGIEVGYLVKKSDFGGHQIFLNKILRFFGLNNLEAFNKNYYIYSFNCKKPNLIIVTNKNELKSLNDIKKKEIILKLPLNNENE